MRCYNEIKPDGQIFVFICQKKKGHKGEHYSLGWGNWNRYSKEVYESFGWGTKDLKEADRKWEKHNKNRLKVR